MIFDKITNSELYFSESTAWQTAIAFIEALAPDAAEEKHNLMGDDMYAMITRYETIHPEFAILEAHRKYVDVQILLSGHETIECYQVDDLLVDRPYDPNKDAEFFVRPTSSPARVTLSPGLFAVFFPKDGHSPQLLVKEIQMVKKVVVKIKKELLVG